MNDHETPAVDADADHEGHDPAVDWNSLYPRSEDMLWNALMTILSTVFNPDDFAPVLFENIAYLMYNEDTWGPYQLQIVAKNTTETGELVDVPELVEPLNGFYACVQAVAKDIKDFRLEPNGMMSFDHPRAMLDLLREIVEETGACTYDTQWEHPYPKTETMSKANLARHFKRLADKGETLKNENPEGFFTNIPPRAYFSRKDLNAATYGFLTSPRLVVEISLADIELAIIEETGSMPKRFADYNPYLRLH